MKFTMERIHEAVLPAESLQLLIDLTGLSDEYFIT